MDYSVTKFSLKRIFKGASIYSLGEVLVKASGFFLIPLYTRVLTPEEYGIIGYLQVFLQIATVIVAFGFNSAQTRYYYENIEDLESVGQFAFTINLIPFGFVVIVCLPLTILSYHFKWSIGTEKISFYPFMTLTLWTVIFQVLANNAVSWYQARQKFFTASILQVTRFLSITALSIIFIVQLKLGALGRISGLFAGMLLFLILSYGFYAKNFIFKPSKKALLYAISYGAPIVVHLLAGAIHNAIDRLVLEHYVSLGELGIYTTAYTIGNALNVFILGFNQAYQPSYFQLMSSDSREKERSVLRIFKIWLVGLSAIAMVGIFLGRPFLDIFIGSEFKQVEVIFPWIILSFFMSSFYYFFSSPIFYFKRTKTLPLITGTSALVNIILNFVLIPLYGITGAAIATVISHTVQSVLAYIIGNKLYKIKWPILFICLSIFILIFCVIFIN